ncbi:hypothetical protein OPT61_g9570 [Boeremia exigua]|uniref:Uncharacterized protein n=1 Tax=Boeremia exigua TaxID=749465 RepID=A0ACC2HTV5_9PLEO|nr:hypothetical protein OPT61_g9570 [Boeremia exigua]
MSTSGPKAMNAAARLNEYKTVLEQLFIVDDRSAKEIAEYMKSEYQVDLNQGDYVWMDKKMRGRKTQGKRTQFLHNGQIVDDAKIQRDIARHVTALQQITTVTTPGTPSGWAAITPAAPKPGGVPSVPHTPVDYIPIERDTDMAVQKEIAQIEVLVQTMLQCGTFITMWARACLPTSRAAMSSRYRAVAEYIVATQHGKPGPLLEGFAEYTTALHILRLAFFDDHLQLGELLQATTGIPDDVLRTALFLTCKGDQHQVAANLLSYGVKPDSKDTEGMPCLTIASRNNLDRIVRLLLRFNANVNITDGAGKTPWLHICGLPSHDVIASILSEAGAKKDLNESNRGSPLYEAAADGHVDQIRVMLERGMNPSFATVCDWQPLHWAASNCKPQVVKTLVEAGADLNPIPVTDGRVCCVSLVFSATQGYVNSDPNAGDLHKHRYERAYQPSDARTILVERLTPRLMHTPAPQPKNCCITCKRSRSMPTLETHRTLPLVDTIMFNATVYEYVENPWSNMGLYQGRLAIGSFQNVFCSSAGARRLLLVNVTMFLYTPLYKDAVPCQLARCVIVALPPTIFAIWKMIHLFQGRGADEGAAIESLPHHLQNSHINQSIVESELESAGAQTGTPQQSTSLSRITSENTSIHSPGQNTDLAGSVYSHIAPPDNTLNSDTLEEP